MPRVSRHPRNVAIRYTLLAHVLKDTTLLFRKADHRQSTTGTVPGDYDEHTFLNGKQALFHLY